MNKFSSDYFEILLSYFINLYLEFVVTLIVSFPVSITKNYKKLLFF